VLVYLEMINGIFKQTILFQASIGYAHPVFHVTASEHPESLLTRDPQLRPYLEKLRRGGKQTFVITNSPFEIVNEVIPRHFDATTTRAMLHSALKDGALFVLYNLNL